MHKQAGLVIFGTSDNNFNSLVYLNFRVDN
jgi:hypothetical protein